MQVQDYLPYFQDLLGQYYQFTLENPVYAACLAVAVWLLTAIFYSLRVFFLNRRNRVTLKACLDARNDLANAQQQNQQLQEELAASKGEIEHEAQRVAVLHERMAALAGQLSESIVALAANPDLGQQGLSVSEGLEAEHLWQRYSAAVKLLSENLLEERKNSIQLQQRYDAETAKLAEKDSQLQAFQTRLDSQNLQLAKLELTAAEHEKQLAGQQEVARQQLAEALAKHQADLARLAVLEQQAREWSQAQKSSEIPKAASVSIPEPEPVKPVLVEPKVTEPQAVVVEPEKPLRVESEPQRPEVKAVTPEPSIDRVETEKPKSKETKASQETAGGVSGKFKSLFAGAKQQMEKLDDMFGLNTPLLEPEEPIQSSRIAKPEVAVAETRIPEPEALMPEIQPETEVKEASSGLGGKFKSLFGSSKSPAVEPVVVPEAVPEVVEPEPALAEAEVADAGAARKAGKLKNLFGKFKRT